MVARVSLSPANWTNVSLPLGPLEILGDDGLVDRPLRQRPSEETFPLRHIACGEPAEDSASDMSPLKGFSPPRTTTTTAICTCPALDGVQRIRAQLKQIRCRGNARVNV